MNLAEIRQNLRDYKLQTEKLRLENYFGQNPAKSREEIEEIFSDLFTFSTVESLKNAAENAAEHTEIEQHGRKILLQISQLGCLQNQTKEISREIEKCRKSVSVKFQDEVLTPANVSEKIKTEENPDVRSELFTRLIEAENICSDLIFERFSQFHENSKKLGFENLRGIFEEISGVEFQNFAAKAEKFLESTEEIYFRLLAEICAETKNLQFSDFLFLNEKIERKSIYAGRHLPFFYAQILENFGFSTGKISQIKLKKVSKYKQTKSFAPNVPDDIFLCFSVKDGAENYLRFLQNFGIAQKNGWTSKSLLKRFPEFVFAPDDCLGTAYGFLFQSLLGDESFLRKSFSVKEEKHINKIIKENNFRLLFETRREVLRFLAEAEIYSSEKPDFEHIWQKSAENFTNNLGFNFKKEQIIFEVSSRNAAQKNVRSRLFAYGLREYFREKYDFLWWNRRAAFEELIDFWNTAERHRAEAMADLIGFETSFDLLAESF